MTCENTVALARARSSPPSGVQISDISRASGSGPPQPPAGATTTATHGSTGPDHCSCCHGHGRGGLAQPPPNAVAAPPRGEHTQGLPSAQEARASHCCHAVSTPNLSIFFQKQKNCWACGTVGFDPWPPRAHGVRGGAVCDCALKQARMIQIMLAIRSS